MHLKNSLKEDSCLTSDKEGTLAEKVSDAFLPTLRGMILRTPSVRCVLQMNSGFVRSTLKISEYLPGDLVALSHAVVPAAAPLLAIPEPLIRVLDADEAHLIPIEFILCMFGEEETLLSAAEKADFFRATDNRRFAWFGAGESAKVRALRIMEQRARRELDDTFVEVRAIRAAFLEIPCFSFLRNASSACVTKGTTLLELLYKLQSRTIDANELTILIDALPEKDKQSINQYIRDQIFKRDQPEQITLTGCKTELYLPATYAPWMLPYIRAAVLQTQAFQSLISQLEKAPLPAPHPLLAAPAAAAAAESDDESVSPKPQAAAAAGDPLELEETDSDAVVTAPEADSDLRLTVRAPFGAPPRGKPARAGGLTPPVQESDEEEITPPPPPPAKEPVAAAAAAPKAVAADAAAALARGAERRPLPAAAISRATEKMNEIWPAASSEDSQAFVSELATTETIAGLLDSNPKYPKMLETLQIYLNAQLSRSDRNTKGGILKRELTPIAHLIIPDREPGKTLTPDRFFIDCFPDAKVDLIFNYTRTKK